MSDSFQAYVFGDALVADGQADFRRVPAWLLSEGVMSEHTGDNALTSDGLGHLPGARASMILKADNAHWRELQVNGVVLESGRQIETSAELEKARCPRCSRTILADDDEFASVMESLDRYAESGDSSLECSSCGKSSDLAEWDFDGKLAIGEYSVTFWNWPEHVPELVSKLGDIAGTKCNKVWGRV